MYFCPYLPKYIVTFAVLALIWVYHLYVLTNYVVHMPGEDSVQPAVNSLIRDFQSLRTSTTKRIVDRLANESRKNLGRERGRVLRAILARRLFEIDPTALKHQLDLLDPAQLQTFARCLAEAREVVQKSSYDYEIEEAVSRVESVLPGTLSVGVS